MKTKAFACCIASIALFLCLEAAEGPGGKVALVRETALWMANADGSEPVQLAEYGLRPAWSPDGSDLGYITKPDHQKSLADIAVMTVATKHVRPFVFRPTREDQRGMRFVEELRLLDHNRIALIGSINPVNCQYVVVDVNTGQERLVPRPLRLVCDQTARPLSIGEDLAGQRAAESNSDRDLLSCASTTAMAAMFTISLTSEPRCSMCTGLDSPIRIGPMASHPPIRISSL